MWFWELITESMWSRYLLLCGSAWCQQNRQLGNRDGRKAGKPEWTGVHKVSCDPWGQTETCICLSSPPGHQCHGCGWTTWKEADVLLYRASCKPGQDLETLKEAVWQKLEGLKAQPLPHHKVNQPVSSTRGLHPPRVQKSRYFQPAFF